MPYVGTLLCWRASAQFAIARPLSDRNLALWGTFRRPAYVSRVPQLIAMNARGMRDGLYRPAVSAARLSLLCKAGPACDGPWWRTGRRRRRRLTIGRCDGIRRRPPGGPRRRHKDLIALKTIPQILRVLSRSARGFKRRGMVAAVLADAGPRSARYSETHEQRWLENQIGNVLNTLPKSAQHGAKRAPQDLDHRPVRYRQQI